MELVLYPRKRVSLSPNLSLHQIRRSSDKDGERAPWDCTSCSEVPGPSKHTLHAYLSCMKNKQKVLLHLLYCIPEVCVGFFKTLSLFSFLPASLRANSRIILYKFAVYSIRILMCVCCKSTPRTSKYTMKALLAIPRALEKVTAAVGKGGVCT